MNQSLTLIFLIAAGVGLVDIDPRFAGGIFCICQH